MRNGLKNPAVNRPDAFASAQAFLSIEQVAQMLGCTRRFIETRIEDGELRVFRPSKRLVRIRRTEFERWVEAFSSQCSA